MNLDTLDTIICDNCNHPIKINEVLINNLKDKISAEEHQKYQEQLKQARKEEAQKLANQNDIRMQEFEIKYEQSQKSNQELRDRLEKSIEKMSEAQEAQKNVETKFRAQLEEEKEAMLQEATQQAQNNYELKLAEKDKKIDDLKKQALNMQRSATQVSGQMTGEVLELQLENNLKNEFKTDLIEEVAKGVRGADVRQIVRNIQGIDCGLILWEAKRTKDWKNDWVEKLKNDALNIKANVSVIVSNVLPDRNKKGLMFYQGLWVTQPNYALALASLLRQRLIEVYQAKNNATHRNDGARALYDYVHSHEFIQKIESLAEIIKELKQGVLKERSAFEKLWAKREKQIDKIWQNTGQIVGSIEGVMDGKTPLLIKEFGIS